MIPEVVDKNSPETVAFVSYLWIVGLALFGGIVSYLKKIKAGKKWQITDFLIEMTTSAFAGVIVFYFCNSIHINQMGTAALVGVAGHFSARAITLFGTVQQSLFKRLVKWIGK